MIATASILALWILVAYLLIWCLVNGYCEWTGRGKAACEVWNRVGVLVFVAPLVILYLVICLLMNVVCFPFYRIPIGRTRELTRMIRHKTIHLGNMFRDGIEERVGNRLLFLDRGSEPKYLYVPTRDLNQLPEETARPRTVEAMRSLTETVVVTVSARPVLLGGWSPARLVDYKVIRQRPEWDK
jgi:hypothetical protein